MERGTPLATDYPLQHSIIINFEDFCVFDEELASELIKHPDEITLSAQRALQQIELPIKKSIGKVNVQFINIPNKIAIRDVRIEHISKLIAVKGIVRKVTKIHPMITNAAFSCIRCKHVIFVPQTSQQLVEPSECENKKCGCKGTFNILSDKSTFVNTHKLQIQELPENVKNGAQPQNIDVYVENCIVRSTTPSARVVINGILRPSQRKLQKGRSKFYDLVLHANSIEYTNNELAEFDISPEDEKKILAMSRNPQIYTNISKTIAPSICGHEDVKEAITLQLFSGVSKCLPDKSKVRGDIHILLVGDPDIGKSQLLQSVIELALHGVFISGKNTPSENLAFTITESDFGDTSWTLEAGPLAMADKGIAAIDDMDGLSLENQNRLHEAMENQTINIKNANITHELKSRCALLAVTNPKYGRFDPYEEIVQQINIQPKMLSSFDLIFMLRDVPNIDTDLRVANHIFDSQCFGEQVNQHRNDSSCDNIQDQTSSQISATCINIWSKGVSDLLLSAFNDLLKPVITLLLNSMLYKLSIFS